MSLCEQLRAEAVQHRDDELTTLASSHKADLRALRAVWNCVQNNTALSPLINAKFDAESVSDDEVQFLKKNRIQNGFDTTILTLRSPPPIPTRQPEDAPTLGAKPTSASAESAHLSHRSATLGLPAKRVPVSGKASPGVPLEPVPAPAVQSPPPGLPLVDSEPALSRAVSPNVSIEPNGPDAASAEEIAPPLPQEDAALPEATPQTLDQRTPSFPAKTVHLPSREVQEERLREREAEEERRRPSDAESKTSQRLQAPHNELASSPSSTVGPYSAATPLLPQESPDTSPNSESAAVEVPPPEDLQPSPEQQREKEEHDRLLEAQKEIARKQALGDIPATPDDQLRWEEREAAAREAEERAAREDVGGPEPDTKNARSFTEAERVVQEVQVDAAAEQPDEAEDVKPATAMQDEDSAEPDDVQTKSETIPATQQKSSISPLDDTRQEYRQQEPQAPAPLPSRPERMITRVSSGALRQKSVSEILGQSQSPSAEFSMSTRREAMSPEPISPMTRRHPQDSVVSGPLTSHASRQPRQLPTRSLSTTSPVLEQLDVLKGASEDPARDYLEPLFRIQAHESPKSGTKTLPELIRMVPKALSTEDHFTSLHERIDFRMLRRIYQLQNANKWSLRQMEKCKEPAQPVTHLDHMMDEMKWMRKDFQAERKLKKTVCAWLAKRCAEWVNASVEARRRLQINAKTKRPLTRTGSIPDLESAGESAPEDDITPSTPRAVSPVPTTVVVAPEISSIVDVEGLRKTGKLQRALVSLPKTGLLDLELRHDRPPVTLVSKFIKGKVLPKSAGPGRKRSRYDYEDEAEIIEAQNIKRRRGVDYIPPEEQVCALFFADQKPVRDRLHSNNAFRPPSEFPMPSTPFYEFRNGSQWIWEDDQKLRKLAKEYSFNWSLIADEMALSTRYKSSAERRTPWECFERWVELESLPADMRKTVYFKTWFQRLEQSQQAAERRYQVQVVALQQAAAQTGAQAHIPIRRRTVPTRVEKRRSARYLWMVDGFRKLAKKREQAAWKQAESARAAAQRKSQSEANPVKMVKMTPQEFSKKRHERDVQILEAQRAHRAKMIEQAQQQRQLAMVRANQAQQPGALGQQRPGPQGTNASVQQAQMQANGQQMPGINGQAAAQQQLRPGMQMAPQRNGHLAPPHVSAQGIPQAQMQARAGMAQHPNLQQMGQNGAQGGAQYPAQQFPMQNGNIPSPGGNITTQQQLQQNQALLQAFQQRQVAGASAANMSQSSGGQQMSGTPSMPPPPTPQNAPGSLSSGHVPQIIAIQNQLRATNPGVSEDQLKAMATQQMKVQSQSSSQARQNAMNAAAGISPQQGHANMQQQQYNQGSYQRNGQPMPNGLPGVYMGTDGNTQQANMSPANSSSPTHTMYAQKMWHRQQLQMQQMQQMQSPNTSHAQLNGSPGVAHVSPNMTPASPSMQYSTTNQMGQMGTPVATMNGQRPPSRSATPQMQRLGSSGSGGMGNNNGMQSPGALQSSSPRNIQASMAR